ncbi:response regulator [Natronomonas sp. EA1]|uniref:response regulator n=1 Tax=Natronomonas sp. EA1 TaxID=3421655 RepID=UPI003EB96CB6
MGTEGTVLIVEDETELVEVYAHWLADQYEVRTSTTGAEALDRLDDSVGVVLLDRRLPGGSGDTILPEIRERTPDVRVAMVTAVDPDFDILTLGFDAYLTKPVDRRTLVDTVDRLFARSAYSELERELFALVSKQVALSESKPAHVLDSSEEIERLTDRIRSVREAMDDELPSVDDDDLVTLVRDIESGGEGDV